MDPVTAIALADSLLQFASLIINGLDSWKQLPKGMNELYGYTKQVSALVEYAKEHLGRHCLQTVEQELQVGHTCSTQLSGEFINFHIISDAGFALIALINAIAVLYERMMLQGGDPPPARSNGLR